MFLFAAGFPHKGKRFLLMNSTGESLLTELYLLTADQVAM
jgi:hypothetical protein